MSDIIQPTVMGMTHARPGDLFFFEHNAGPCLCLCTVGPGGSLTAVTLGQNFMGENSPRVIGISHHDVLNFGKNYRLHFDAQPSSWHFGNHEYQEDAFMALYQGEPYIRAARGAGNFNYESFFINMKSGQLGTGLPDVVAYSRKWEIHIPESEYFPEQILHRHNPIPPEEIN